MSKKKAIFQALECRIYQNPLEKLKLKTIAFGWTQLKYHHFKTNNTKNGFHHSWTRVFLLGIIIKLVSIYGMFSAKTPCVYLTMKFICFESNFNGLSFGLFNVWCPMCGFNLTTSSRFVGIKTVSFWPCRSHSFSFQCHFVRCKTTPIWTSRSPYKWIILFSFWSQTLIYALFKNGTCLCYCFVLIRICVSLEVMQ